MDRARVTGSQWPCKFLQWSATVSILCWVSFWPCALSTKPFNLQFQAHRHHPFSPPALPSLRCPNQY